MSLLVKNPAHGIQSATELGHRVDRIAAPTRIPLSSAQFTTVDEPAISAAHSMSNLVIPRRSWRLFAIAGALAAGVIALVAVNRMTPSPAPSSASILPAHEAIEVQPAVAPPSPPSAKFAAMKGGGCAEEPKAEPAHVDPAPVDTGDVDEDMALPVEPAVAECSAPIGEPAYVETKPVHPKKHVRRAKTKRATN